jgi:hypothetical protein
MALGRLRGTRANHHIEVISATLSGTYIVAALVSAVLLHKLLLLAGDSLIAVSTAIMFFVFAVSTHFAHDLLRVSSRLIAWSLA